MEKIKRFIENEKGKDILIAIIVVLVGLISFGLGRLSKENTLSGVKIEYSGQKADIIKSLETNASNTQSITQNVKKTNSGNYFASNRGKKYYPVNCSAGKTIKEENKVYFTTREDAQNAGYELSSACQ